MPIINYFIDFNHPEPVSVLREVMIQEKKKNRSSYIIKLSKKESLLAKLKTVTIKVPFTFISFIISSLFLLSNVIIFSSYFLIQTTKIYFSLFSCLILLFIIYSWFILYVYTESKIQVLNFKNVIKRYFRQENIDLTIENLTLVIQDFKNIERNLKEKSGFFLDLSRLYCEQFHNIFIGSLLISGYFEALLKLKLDDMLEINPFGTLFICSILLSLKYIMEVKDPIILLNKAIKAMEQVKEDVSQKI
ncbi:hypothetical protein H1P_2080005 [Hyella patelloides LEGE 07179]|uniref:Uncharacterized protein n=1 Tax=Hyella patelloides LEGE 07179 TaxID=945734 RepID=A0A563VQD2_9CYAN|nr:hypothetical protein [Hyella patelloides]VEP13610.1 hypothetical protein H1P_2080005 [Hyella patelloides LEGE 07179]